jgi:hypothetical protein
MDMEKILKNVLKVASVLLTSPATLEVAGGLYPDQWAYRIIVSVAALLLVEGALLLGWYMLDNNKKATNAQRWLYAALAGVAYVGLWIVAVSHGEGAAGIVFRSTIGVLLGYSVFESGILADVKLRQAVEKDINKHRRIRKAQEKADIEVALAGINSSKSLRLESLNMETARSQQRLKLEDKAEVQKLRTQDRELSETALLRSESPGLARRGQLATVEQAREARQMKKSRRLELVRDLLRSNPEIGGTEYLEQLGAAIRNEFGVKAKISDTQAFDDLKLIRAEILVPVGVNGNGNGHSQN